FFIGENKHSYEIGNQLLEYGKMNFNIRCQVAGHICLGHSYFSEGNMSKAILCYRQAVEVAEDPFYSQWPRLFLGICCVLNKQMKEGEEALKEVASYAHKFGCDIFSPVVKPILGIVLIQKGKMSKGLKIIEETSELSKEKNFIYGVVLSEFLLGNVYYEIAYGEKPTLSIIRKNAGFLAKNIPFAAKKAESYFNKAIENSERSGIKGFQGMAYLGLGALHKAKKRSDLAKKCLSKAIKIFERCGAKMYLEQAKELVASLR
ncbi:MAG: tetratricopeptide repeat protein, partial [Deltaproteobacteria bacterium]